MQEVSITIFTDQRNRAAVALNDRRVAGVKPALGKNVIEEYQVPLAEIARALHLEDLAGIPCCHTSGMHDPVHFQERKYICSDQKAEAFDALCAVLGINPATTCRPDCGWCKDYPEKQAGAGLTLAEDKKQQEERKAKK